MVSNLELLKKSFDAIGIICSNEMLVKISNFEENLYKVNEYRNLTRVTRQDCLRFHFLDSALMAEFIPLGSKVLDIGTGPGFPAWPLACLREDMQVTAIDSNLKMTSFLKAQILPNLTVINARAEDILLVDKRLGNEFDVVTGRATAPLAIQLELSSPFCKVGGHVIPMRTAREKFVLAKIKTLGLELKSVEIRDLPLIESDDPSIRNEKISRAFPIYHKLTNSALKRIRKWSEMKSNPIV